MTNTQRKAILKRMETAYDKLMAIAFDLMQNDSDRSAEIVNTAISTLNYAMAKVERGE